MEQLKNQFLKRVAMAISFGDICDNGVCFEWHLSGPNGAAFTLLKEDTHTTKHINDAKKELRRNRDVTHLKVVTFNKPY